MRGKSYSYKHLKLKPETFKLLCGVSTEQFELLMDCIRPYLSLLDSGELRVPKVIDRATQYMAVLTICFSDLVATSKVLTRECTKVAIEVLAPSNTPVPT